MNLEEISRISKYLILPKNANKKGCVIYQRCVCISEKGIVKPWQDPRICSIQSQPFWGCCSQRPAMKPRCPQSQNRFEEGTKCLGELRWPTNSCLTMCAEVFHARSTAVRTSGGMHSGPRAAEGGDFQGWVVTQRCSWHSPHVIRVPEGSFCHLEPTAASKSDALRLLPPTWF